MKEASSPPSSEELQDYKPLIVVIIFSAVLACVQAQSFHNLMSFFMGYFFVFLAMFKFFDIKGFVEGFSTYDLMSKKLRVYGYSYPFLEFFLGMAYLSEFDPKVTNWITLILMVISGLGVLKSVSQGQKIKCACLGTALNVPLSTVSIIENFGMGAMAAYMLYAGNV